MEKVQKKEKIIQTKTKDSTNGKVSQLVSDTPLMLKKSNENEMAFGGAMIQQKENNTGLPNNLKSGIESLSGYSMDDVNVHYNSSKPTQLNAHAFAQGTDIHVASGQEKHLAHEAWHVVQQKQGRVQANRQMKGNVNINDDAGLEQEADVMGEKALQMNSVDSKQSLVGNSSSIIQKQEVSEINFLEEDVDEISSVVYNLGGAGRRPTDTIQGYISRIVSTMNSMRTTQLAAINQFLTHMSFSSTSEAQPDILGAIFNHVGQELFNTAIGKLPNIIGGITPASVITIMSVIHNEFERASSAQSSYNIGSFMTNLRNQTLAIYNEQITQINSPETIHELEQNFSELGSWTNEQNIVIGEQGAFLRNLDSASRCIVPIPFSVIVPSISTANVFFSNRSF